MLLNQYQERERHGIQVLKVSQALNSQDIRCWMRQLCLAVTVLERTGLIHGDIRLGNMLLVWAARVDLCSTPDPAERPIFSRPTVVTKVATQQSIRTPLNSNFQLLLLLSMAMVCTVLGLILKTSGSGDRAAAGTPECGGRGGDDDISDRKR